MPAPGLRRSDALVFAQFALLAALLLPGPAIWRAAWLTAVAAALMLAGIGLAGAGVAALGRDLVPWVAPRPGARLRTRGVYRWTRNPVYLGILVAAAGWTLWRARVEIMAVWALLAVVLVVKAHVEQGHLVAAFGDEYRDYAARTPLILFRRGIR